MAFKIRPIGIFLTSFKRIYLQLKSEILPTAFQNKNLHSLSCNPILALSTHTRIQHARITRSRNHQNQFIAFN